AVTPYSIDSYVAVSLRGGSHAAPVARARRAAGPVRQRTRLDAVRYQAGALAHGRCLAAVRAGGALLERAAGRWPATRRGRCVVHGGRRGGLSGPHGSGAVWSGHLFPEAFPTAHVLEQRDGPGPSPGCVGVR